MRTGNAATDSSGRAGHNAFKSKYTSIHMLKDGGLDTMKLEGGRDLPGLNSLAGRPGLGLGYARGLAPNESLGALAGRVIARMPWRPVLQRVPGVWLFCAMLLAVFGPSRAPILYYAYTVYLNYVFLNNNVRTLFGIIHAYRESVKHATTDWLGQYLSKTGASSGEDTSHDMPFDHILHVVLIPAYMEDLDTLCETLDVLASHRRALTQYRICLAMEASEPGSESKARMLLKMYTESFFDIAYTIHPANLPGEIRGKSSNVAWASRQMARYSASAAANAAAAAEESIYGVSCCVEGDFFNASTAEKSDPFNAKSATYGNSTRHDHEIVTVMDADSCFAEDYFTAVAYHYAVASPEQRKIMMFMPSTVFDRNSDRVPIFVRVVDMYWSLGVISNMFHDSKVKLPCSAYSVSMDLCIAVDFWDTGPEALGEDLHMYLKCLFSTRGQLITKSIFSAVSCCNIEGSYNPVGDDPSVTGRIRRWTSGFVARYYQARRHLWGSLDSCYAIRRAIIATLAPEYDNYIQLKNAGVSKVGKDDNAVQSNTFAPGVLSVLFSRLIEAHIAMGQVGSVGLIRSILSHFPDFEKHGEMYSSSQTPILQVFGVPINVQLMTTIVLSICTVCNFLSAIYYEKYFKFVGFERWALQSVPSSKGNSPTNALNRSEIKSKLSKSPAAAAVASSDDAACVANNRLVGLATMAKHGLKFSKDHENLAVYPLGRRPQLSSPRYTINLCEWILIPYAAVFYFLIPQFNAQICHLFTDRLDYKVAGKPHLGGANNCSLATLTMEEVVASAKGMYPDDAQRQPNGDWNGDADAPYPAEIVVASHGSSGSSSC